MELCEDIIHHILEYIMSPTMSFLTTDIIGFEVYESSIIKYSDILQLYKIKKIKYIIEKYFKNVRVRMDSYKRKNRQYYSSFHIIENMILPVKTMSYNIDIGLIEKLNIFNKIDYLKIRYISYLGDYLVITPKNLIGKINKIEIHIDEICLFYNMVNELKIKTIILTHFNNENKYNFKEISSHINKLNNNCKLLFKTDYIRTCLLRFIKRNGYKLKKNSREYEEFILINPYEEEDYDLYKEWNLNDNLKLKKFTKGMSWVYNIDTLHVKIDDICECGIKRKIEF